MKQITSIFKLSYSLVALTLFAVLPACSSIQDSNQNNSAHEDSAAATAPEAIPTHAVPAPQNTEVKTTPDCTPESQDPMCRPVLVGGEGDAIVIGTAEIRGSFQIEYNSNGTIAKVLSFDPAHPDKPRRTKALTYNEAGQIETVTIEEDDNLLDSVLDHVEKTTLIYTDGNLETETGTKKEPSQPTLPMLITLRKYQDMGSDMTGSVYTEGDFNHVHAQVDTYQKSTGPLNYEMVKRSNWSPAAQALVLKTSEASFQRWDSSTHTKLGFYAYCDVAFGQNTDCDPFSQNFTKQYTVTTYYQHQGKKLTTAITGIDGDKRDLQNNISDGVQDRTIECSVTYDETTKSEPHPLPEEVKSLGLSGKEAVKSIECTEGQSKSVYQFHYEPLWKVVGRTK